MGDRKGEECRRTKAEGRLGKRVARGQRCLPGRWREHCPAQQPTFREQFVSKRIKGRSPGARVVLGNGGNGLLPALLVLAGVEVIRVPHGAELAQRIVRLVVGLCLTT